MGSKKEDKLEHKISRLKITNSKMVAIYPNAQLISLIVNGIYTLFKRLRLFRSTLSIRIEH